MSLEKKTLGIVGAGRIGREVARRAEAFGMSVVYWARSRHDEFERTRRAEFLELDELLRVADVVSVHLSRSKETERLLDARRLALMRDGSVLVNTARGSIIDEQALVHELLSGRISAGLDVYQHEPAVPVELLRLENVVLLPHLGSATHDARLGMWELAWANLVAGVTGLPLISPIS